MKKLKSVHTAKTHSYIHLTTAFPASLYLALNDCCYSVSHPQASLFNPSLKNQTAEAYTLYTEVC